MLAAFQGFGLGDLAGGWAGKQASRALQDTWQRVAAGFGLASNSWAELGVAGAKCGLAIGWLGTDSMSVSKAKHHNVN